MRKKGTKIMKVILLSDSHTNYEALDIVRNKYKDADLMVHCGDCLLKPEKMKGFLAVHGNLDNPRELPLEETIMFGEHRILIKHGHDVIIGAMPDYRRLAAYAKEKGFNTVFFGHTHTYCDQTVDGVRLLNPGSVWKNRDGSPACLMELTITKTAISAKRVSMIDLRFS